MISAGAMRILKRMTEAEAIEEWEDAEIVCDGRTCYVGLDSISKACVYELLRFVLISDESEQGKGVERYSLNEEGRAMVADPNYVPKIVPLLEQSRSKTVRSATADQKGPGEGSNVSDTL